MFLFDSYDVMMSCGHPSCTLLDRRLGDSRESYCDAPVLVPGESVHVMAREFLPKVLCVQGGGLVMARGFLPMVLLCAGWGLFLLSDLIVII